MNIKSLALLTLGALLAGCGANPSGPTPTSTSHPSRPIASQPAYAPQQVKTDKQGRYVANQLIVKTDASTAQQLAGQLSATVSSSIPELGVYLLTLPAGQNALNVAQHLNHPGSAASPVRYAAANRLLEREKVVAHPADLSTGQATGSLQAQLLQTQSLQPQSTNRVFDRLPQYALDAQHMNAKAAWDAGLTGRGVTVGVIDDPADVTHPDLKANWAGKAYDPVQDTTYTTAQDWIDWIDGQDGKLDQAVTPDDEHATGVSSTIVAARDGQGMVGVAPDAKFTTAAIFQPDSVSDFYVAKAIVWSVKQGDRVLNNSFGSSGYSDLVKDAMDYALANQVVVVASAGNEGRQNYSSPAQYPGVITSEALNIDNSHAAFSTTSRTASVSAPGVDILMASPLWINADGTKKSGATAPGGTGYQLADGTSFSSPLTAGAAALVLGARPDLDPYQVRRLLEETADGSVGSNPNGFDLDTGYGLVKLDRLAQRLKAGPIPSKGGAAIVHVVVQTASGSVPAALSDVVLEGQGDHPQIYGARTDDQGDALFVAIAPGTYTLHVGTPDLAVTGGFSDERETYTAPLTVDAGTEVDRVAPTVVTMHKGSVDFDPQDPYEPNDTPETATPISYGTTTRTAYIAGKPRDLDYFRFDGQKGDVVSVNVLARHQLGGLLDACVVLRDASGNILELNDDAPGIGPDPAITDFTLPDSGSYFLEVGSNQTLCLVDPNDPSQGLEDDSPFNKYQLQLTKK